MYKKGMILILMTCILSSCMSLDIQRDMYRQINEYLGSRNWSIVEKIEADDVRILMIGHQGEYVIFDFSDESIVKLHGAYTIEKDSVQYKEVLMNQYLFLLVFGWNHQKHMDHYELVLSNDDQTMRISEDVSDKSTFMALCPAVTFFPLEVVVYDDAGNIIMKGKEYGTE